MPSFAQRAGSWPASAALIGNAAGGELVEPMGAYETATVRLARAQTSLLTLYNSARLYETDTPGSPTYRYVVSPRKPPSHSLFGRDRRRAWVYAQSGRSTVAARYLSPTRSRVSARSTSEAPRR